jgi:hypothetical protein
MSRQPAVDKKSAIRGRMGVLVNAVKVAAARTATRPRRSSKALKIRNRLHFEGRARKFGRFRAEPEFDSATLVALAMDRLTPALLRASIIGVPVTVEVPDERTAEVFRAALAKTRSGRPTDRLVEVVAKSS